MPKRLEELDSLRGIAAIMVVVFHFGLKSGVTNIFLKIGLTGVDLFFLISGYVIFMTLTKVPNVKVFFINRFARLFPTYWFCVICTSLSILIFQPNFTSIRFFDFLANMTMFQNNFGVEDIDGSYWTMPIEMTFYILMACILFFKQTKNIVLIGVLLLALVQFYDSILCHYFVGIASFLSKKISLFNHYPLFFAGILFYKLHHHTVNPIRYYALLMLCYFIQLHLFENGGRLVGNVDFVNYGITLCIYFGLFTLFVNNHLGFIKNKIFLFLGKISFPLYLIHQFIGNEIVIPCLVSLHFSYFISAITTIFIVIGIAFLISKYIEIPMNVKLKNILMKRL